jgi:hypothetical protein
VIYLVTTVHCSFHGGLVEQIGVRDLDSETGQEPGVAGRTGHGPNGISVRHQTLGEVTAHEARGAGYEREIGHASILEILRKHRHGKP